VAGIADRFGFPLLAVVPDDTQATTDEPLVLNDPDSPAADAYQRLTEALEGLFFQGETVEEDLETIVDDDWFADGESTEPGDGGDDGDEEDGVFGLFND